MPTIEKVRWILFHVKQERDTLINSLTVIDETKTNYNNIILKSSETHAFKVCFVQFSYEATKFTAKKPHK